MTDAPVRADGARDREGPDGPMTESAIRDLVVAFYDDLRAEPVLGPLFEARLAGRWEAHLEHMGDFWSAVLRGTRRFHGDPMGTHAAIPGIAPAHFARWADLFRETAQRVLPERHARDVAARAERMRVALERRAFGAPPTATPLPVRPADPPSTGDSAT